MHVVLEVAVGLKMHSANDSDHGGWIGAQPLGQGAYAQQDKLARPLENLTNDLLSFGAEKVDARRRAHDRNRTRDFPRLFHRAEEHVGKHAFLSTTRFV